MKKFLSLFIALAIIITLAGPAQTVDAAKTRYIIKTDVVYDIFVKEKITLYVDTSKKLTWSTSNKKIATVSSKGIVVGKTPGNVTITASTSTKKYKCKVVVWSPDEEVVYFNDVAPAEPTDRYAASEYNVSTDEKSSDKNTDGIVSYYQGGVTIPKSDSEWIISKDLFSKYGYSMIWSSKGLSLSGESKYLLVDAPRSMTTDTIYECKYNDITIHMKYNDEYYFNIADLKAIGLIK